MAARLAWGFQPTYEGLKPFRLWSACAGSRSFQPTYEGLKQEWVCGFCDRVALFPAYLRGIETQTAIVPRGIVPRFQPTYEGLKPFCMGCWAAGHWGFQPTYEGLKLAQEREVEDGAESLQPTYEGLKRDGGARPAPGAPVCSLPTRD